MQIGLVTDWFPPRIGGVERQVAGLAQALAARGHTVHVLTTTHDPQPIPGVTLHPIRATMLGDVAAPALWRIPELRALLVDAGVEIVHAHGMFSTLAIGSLLAADKAGIPSITTHHSLLRQSPTLPAAWLTYRLFSRHATLVTAVSRAAAADARRASGRTDVPILPNGFDPTTWTLQPEETATNGRNPDERPRVVSVMRLARKKSPRDLIDAVPLVRKRSHPDVIFTVVGDGPDRPALERRAQQLGVGSSVEFSGACSPSQIREILASSTVFALPSRREAFGIALLEARAAGVPTVAWNTGGVPEVIEHERHGLLADTPQAFAEAIARLLGDRVLRERFARTSREGLHVYNWESVVEIHERVYERAIGSGRKAQGLRSFRRQ